jgi:cytochrome P450
VDGLALELQQAPAPLRLVGRMRRFAFSVIATVVLGLEGSDVEALFADFEIWTRALFSVPIAIPGSPFARALQAWARLLERLKLVLQRAPEQRSGGLDLLSGAVDEAGLPSVTTTWWSSCCCCSSPATRPRPPR